MAKVLKNKSIEVRMQEELFKEIERYNGIKEIDLKVILHYTRIRIM